MHHAHPQGPGQLLAKSYSAAVVYGSILRCQADYLSRVSVSHVISFIFQTAKSMFEKTSKNCDSLLRILRAYTSSSVRIGGTRLSTVPEHQNLVYNICLYSASFQSYGVKLENDQVHLQKRVSWLCMPDQVHLAKFSHDLACTLVYM